MHMSRVAFNIFITIDKLKKKLQFLVSTYINKLKIYILFCFILISSGLLVYKYIESNQLVALYK
jgi:hypothetical protein